MRAVVQRVKKAWVEVKGETVGDIGRGLLVLLGVGESDSERDSDYLGRNPHATTAPQRLYTGASI